MNSDILSKISKKITETDDQKLECIIGAAESKLKEPFFPKVMLVSNDYGRQEILDLMRHECSQSEMLQECLPDSGRPFWVTLSFGKPDVTEESSSIGEQEYTKITAAVEWDFLKTANLVWLCGFDFSSLNMSLIEDADVIVLVTNATMALPQEEKDWLRNSVASSFYGEQVLISLYSRSHVNTKEDYECLHKNVNMVLNGLDSKIGFYDDLFSVFAAAAKLLQTTVSEEKHKKMVIKNCLNCIEQRVSELLKASNLDTEKLKTAIEKMERERKDIEMSGRLLMESSVENMYANLKNQIVDAADRYNEDAYNSIRDRIETTKNVEQDVDSIHPYLKAVWENFENEIKAKFAAEQDKISGDLERQMEQVRSSLVRMLDLGEGSELMQHLGIAAGSVAYTGNPDEASKKSHAKLLSKGLMLASIALAFVNPVWGLAAFVGTRFFQRSRENSSEDLRRKVLDELHGECSSIKEKVVEQITAVIAEAKENSKKNIGNVFSEMIDSMMDSILNFIEQIKKLQKQEELLQAIVSGEIPAIRNLM